MMSRTLGAPLGGTTRGAHQGVESLALSLMTPPNLGGGGGSCFPSSVVVALGEPRTPVTCWAAAGAAASTAASRNTAAPPFFDSPFIRGALSKAKVNEKPRRPKTDADN